MPPETLESLIRQILQDKLFDGTRFVTSPLFEEFLNLSLENFQKFALIKDKKKMRDTTPLLKNIFQCLQKLVTFAKAGDFSPETKRKLNLVFSCMFHPETSMNYRKSCLEIFPQYLFMFSDGDIFEFFKTSLILVVPMPFFSQNDKILAEWLKIVPADAVSILEKTASQGDESFAREMLMMWLEVLRQQWSMREEVCNRIFYNYVLAVFYGDMAERSEMKLEIAKTSFDPGKEARGILKGFLKQFTDSDPKNILRLLDTIEHTSFLIEVLNAFSKFANSEDPSGINAVLKNIVHNDDAVKLLMGYSNDFLLGLPGTVCVILTAHSPNGQTPPQYILNGADDFLRDFFPVMLKFIARDALINEIKTLFRRHHYDKFASGYMMMWFIHTMMNSDEKDEELWRLLTKLAKKSAILSAMSSRYAQYLAALAFPTAYGLSNWEAAVQTVKDPKLSGMIGKAAKTPSLYIKEDVGMSWKSQQEHDKMMSTVLIPDLVTDKLGDKIERFLSSFDYYPDVKSSKKQMEAFAPIYSFCEQCVALDVFEAGIEYDSKGVCEMCLNRLVFAVVSQPEITIRQRSLDILMKLFAHGNLKRYMDEGILSSLYTTVTTCLLSTDDDLIKQGFKFGMVLIEQGLAGSSSLVNLMLICIEQKLVPFSEVVVNFLSSMPLFEISTGTLKPIFPAIAELMEKFPRSYASNAREMMNTEPVNMKQRAHDCMFKLPNKWEYVLTGYAAILADQMQRDEPSVDVVSRVFGKYKEALESGTLIMIDILRTTSMYFDKLQKWNATVTTEFIESITKILLDMTLREDNKLFIYNFMNVITEAFIYCFATMKNNKIYPTFVTKMLEFTESQMREITAMVEYCLGLLAVHYGRHPFPHGNLFIGSEGGLVKKKGSNELYAVNGTAIWKLKDGHKRVKVDTQIPVGHYRWSFKPACKDFLKDETATEFTFPDQICTAPTKSKTQEAFKAKFDNTINECFGKEPLDIIEPDSIADELENVRTWNTTFTDSPAPAPTPSKHSKVCIGHTRAAVPAVCGVVHDLSTDRMRPMELTSSIQRHVENLNGLNYRYNWKVGVIYLGENTINQNDIFKAELNETSSRFQEMLTGLGWPVDLATHSAYDGILDCKKGSNGDTSIFHADFSNETMFHVAPLMPTDPQDTAHVKKKRHIGNDHVHIVYTDNDRQYRPGTITSQFNQCHIMMHPLSQQGLYHVSVASKPEMKWFGPLRGSMVITKAMLPSLVRATSVSAMLTSIYREKVSEAVSDSSDPYQIPQTSIAEPLSMAIKECSLKEQCSVRALMTAKKKKKKERSTVSPRARENARTMRKCFSAQVLGSLV